MTKWPYTITTAHLLSNNSDKNVISTREQKIVCGKSCRLAFSSEKQCNSKVSKSHYMSFRHPTNVLGNYIATAP